jgi:EAL domain-containing protein (putative c-di-GMP-specific phosphodiesterase class I)
MPARSLSDATLPDAIARLLEDRQVGADRLTLEIAEASVMHEQTRTLPGLRELAALGLRVAVDGFGTSHSSLSYLRRMPIRQVKIDASFIRRIDHDSSDEAVVRSIVDLGAKLGLDVVAEGVDQQAVWDHLRRMGCGHAQGSLLARPMPLPDLLTWLDDDDPALRRLLTGPRLNVNSPRTSMDVWTSDPLSGQAS